MGTGEGFLKGELTGGFPWRAAARSMPGLHAGCSHPPIYRLKINAFQSGPEALRSTGKNPF